MALNSELELAMAAFSDPAKKEILVRRSHGLYSDLQAGNRTTGVIYLAKSAYPIHHMIDDIAELKGTQQNMPPSIDLNIGREKLHLIEAPSCGCMTGYHETNCTLNQISSLKKLSDLERRFDPENVQRLVTLIEQLPNKGHWEVIDDVRQTGLTEALARKCIDLVSPGHELHFSRFLRTKKDRAVFTPPGEQTPKLPWYVSDSGINLTMLRDDPENLGSFDLVSQTGLNAAHSTSYREACRALIEQSIADGYQYAEPTDQPKTVRRFLSYAKSRIAVFGL